jgi:hypothetical protein
MYKFSAFLVTALFSLAAHATSFEESCSELGAELESLDCGFGLLKLKEFIDNSASTLNELDRTQATSFLEALEAGETLVIKYLGKYSEDRVLNEPMNGLLTAYVKFQSLIYYRVNGKYWNQDHIAQLVQAQSELINAFPLAIEETYNKSLNTDTSDAGAG